MNLQSTILEAARLVVPPAQRAEWFAEWQAELCCVPQNIGTAFCLGAFRDAWWLRRNSLPCPGQASIVASPYHCILLLAAMAAALLFSPFRWHFPERPAPSTAGLLGGAALMGCLVAFINFCQCVLPRCLEFLSSIGERPMIFLDIHQPAPVNDPPASCYALRGVARLRRFVFFAIKNVLLGMIVVCGSVDLGPAAGFGLAFSYIVVFRWAIADQRKRCPVCLRRLINPTRIGEASHMFLDWYGTELVCARGHGLLHTPEIPTSCYSTDHWLCLDPSWNSLFSPELSARSYV
jgi:hypothetical protein